MGKGKWARFPCPAATKITVQANGNPIILGKDGKVHRGEKTHGGRWMTMSGAHFTDIAVGADGSLVATKENGNMVKADHNKWVQVYNSAWPTKPCESGEKRIHSFTSKFALNW